jgi:RHS repeat-associated protein
MTDSKGVVVWDAEYKPFGGADISQDWQVENNFRFAGQYFDKETGLHYNYHRYYDPKNGRYLRPDPIGLKGGMNLFTHVQNNPINQFDYYGLKPKYLWEWIPSYDFFVKPGGYMYNMRYKFKQEHNRRLKICKERYDVDLCENSNSRLIESNYNTCIEFYNIFEYYSENYGYWHAMINSWIWTEDENIERFINKLRPVEYDIFYYWTGEEYIPTP